MTSGKYIKSEEHRKNLSLAKKGKKLSEKHRKNISLSQIGNHRNLGIKRKPFSEEWKRKIGLASKNRPSSMKGKKHSEETKLKMSLQRRGKNHPNWQGGKTSINTRIRVSREYKLWRTAVFERDNYTCIWCGKRGGKLNADHIKPFALFPELRFAIDNGRTLCIDCHKKTDSYLRRLK